VVSVEKAGIGRTEHFFFVTLGFYLTFACSPAGGRQGAGEGESAGI
jgi:hypothetical protein